MGSPLMPRAIALATSLFLLITLLKQSSSSLIKMLTTVSELDPEIFTLCNFVVCYLPVLFIGIGVTSTSEVIYIDTHAVSAKPDIPPPTPAPPIEEPTPPHAPKSPPIVKDKPVFTEEELENAPPTSSNLCSAKEYSPVMRRLLYGVTTNSSREARESRCYGRFAEAALAKQKVERERERLAEEVLAQPEPGKMYLPRGIPLATAPHELYQEVKELRKDVKALEDSAYLSDKVARIRHDELTKLVNGTSIQMEQQLSTVTDAMNQLQASFAKLTISSTSDSTTSTAFAVSETVSPTHAIIPVPSIQLMPATPVLAEHVQVSKIASAVEEKSTKSIIAEPVSQATPDTSTLPPVTGPTSKPSNAAAVRPRKTQPHIVALATPPATPAKVNLPSSPACAEPENPPSPSSKINNAFTPPTSAEPTLPSPVSPVKPSRASIKSARHLATPPSSRPRIGAAAAHGRRRSGRDLPSSPDTPSPSSAAFNSTFNSTFTSTFTASAPPPLTASPSSPSAPPSLPAIAVSPAEPESIIAEPCASITSPLTTSDELSAREEQATEQPPTAEVSTIAESSSNEAEPVASTVASSTIEPVTISPPSPPPAPTEAITSAPSLTPLLVEEQSVLPHPPPASRDGTTADSTSTVNTSANNATLEEALAAAEASLSALEWDLGVQPAQLDAGLSADGLMMSSMSEETCAPVQQSVEEAVLVNDLETVDFEMHYDGDTSFVSEQYLYGPQLAVDAPPAPSYAPSWTDINAPASEAAPLAPFVFGGTHPPAPVFAALPPLPPLPALTPPAPPSTPFVFSPSVPFIPSPSTYVPHDHHQHPQQQQQQYHSSALAPSDFSFAFNAPLRPSEPPAFNVEVSMGDETVAGKSISESRMEMPPPPVPSTSTTTRNRKSRTSAAPRRPNTRPPSSIATTPAAPEASTSKLGPAFDFSATGAPSISLGSSGPVVTPKATADGSMEGQEKTGPAPSETRDSAASARPIVERQIVAAPSSSGASKPKAFSKPLISVRADASYQDWEDGNIIDWRFAHYGQPDQLPQTYVLLGVPKKISKWIDKHDNLNTAELSYEYWCEVKRRKFPKGQERAEMGPTSFTKLKQIHKWVDEWLLLAN